MAPPVNDNLSNATKLTGDYGIAYGTNVDATAEAGEPKNNGRTVWFKWQCLTAGNYRFATRRAALEDFGNVPQTNFATVLTAYAATSEHPGFADLQQLDQNARYANWQYQSEVVFSATQGNWYFIRVDGNKLAVGGDTKTGLITLWWGLFQDLVPAVGGCPACVQGTLDGATCLGTWSPDVTHYQEFDFANTSGEPGFYMLVYCGGAVGLPYATNIAPTFGQILYQWQTIGSGAFLFGDWSMPTLPEWVTGNIIALQYGSGGNRFSDAGFAVNGFSGNDSPASAANLLVTALQGKTNCAVYPITHDGTGPIAMQFTAPSFNPSNPDGVTAAIQLPPDGKAPTFSLLKLIPKFSAKSSCGDGPELTGDGSFYIYLTVSNDSSYDWSGFATLAGPGLVVQLGQGQAWSCAGKKTFKLTFKATVTNKDMVATVTLGSASMHYQTVAFDLTPVLINITAKSAGKSLFDATKNHIVLSWQKSNGLPFTDLQPAISFTGGVAGTFSSNDGSAQSPIDAGYGNDCSNGPGGQIEFDISTTTVKPSSVTLTVSWYDNGVLTNLPVSKIVVPLTWT